MSTSNLSGSLPLPAAAARRTGQWLFSWPLLCAAFAYLYALSRAESLLGDGDTLWHIATGRWIMEHGAVPTQDPFSHTMAGGAWTAHEWLSEIVLAVAHQAGGFNLVVAVTALAFAVTIALLCRTLLRWVEPIYALLFVGFAVALTSGHLLARPHMLAMPLVMAWAVEMVRATEARRTPSLWLLPVMVAWANLHGGFTFGFVLAGAAALEAIIDAPAQQRIRVAGSWLRFIVLALASSLATPHGFEGIYFTWHVLVANPYAISRIGEWQSMNFHTPNAFEVWLLSGFALVLFQGLRLPLVRLLVLLGLMHLALKHVRYIEFLGLLVPLYVAGPFAQQWKARAAGQQHAERLDRLFNMLAGPAGRTAVLANCLALALVTALAAKMRVLEPPPLIAPVAAVDAAIKAGAKGPVLNGYGTGGYLVFRGIPVFIDGRADMYGDDFLRRYVEAMEMRNAEALPGLITKYGVTWTLLEVGNSAASVLDRMEGWKRVFADKYVVVHMRVAPAAVAKPD
jgi:hypothetical protein